jgi:hypothetical protein
MEEPENVGPLTDVNKRCCRRCGGSSEELDFGVRVGVPGPVRRGAGPWPSWKRLRVKKSAGFVRPGMSTTRYWYSASKLS